MEVTETNEEEVNTGTVRHVAKKSMKESSSYGTVKKMKQPKSEAGTQKKAEAEENAEDFDYSSTVKRTTKKVEEKAPEPQP